ncbi:MAG: hypothetical protein QOJ35_3126, partial [Solirubrobacteraceae bacterium]|nr:hypothetical protein [Solirubrobacteraceae bacterium]
MGGALHPGVARAGASFELESLELDDGRLVVRGWWVGVRGMRFVRPALIVDDRQVLATLEHKPWAAEPDGAWVAAFPWKQPRVDVGGVTLAVAPSVEVPLDREAQPPAPRPTRAAEPAPTAPPVPPAPRPARAAEAAQPTAPPVPLAPRPARAAEPTPEPAPPAPLAPRSARAAETAPSPAPPAPLAPRPTRASEPAPEPAPPSEEAAPQTRVRELREPLRDELAAVERRLDDVRDELHEARAIAAERASRCRELERLVAGERQAARQAQATDDELVRSHAMAVLDRDRALAQLEEAVGAREAAVRARKRSEAQRDEGLARGEAAEARRDEALAERDEARRQRDDVLLGYSTLQAQLNDAWARSQRAGADRATPGDDEPTRPLPARETARAAPAAASATATRAPAAASPKAARPPAAASPTAAPATQALPDEPAPPLGEAPLGVRVIPAAGRVGGHLHRSQRAREQRVTK